MKTCRFPVLTAVMVAAVAACASSGNPPEQADENTLTADEVAARPGEPVEVMLQRKFPGIQVLRNSDGDITLQIRGMTSVTGEPKEPMYVVNGMEMRPNGQGLSSIVNPFDIEMITVLKGPAAAIYGMGATDGVIVITTKGATRSRQ